MMDTRIGSVGIAGRHIVAVMICLLLFLGFSSCCDICRTQIEEDTARSRCLSRSSPFASVCLSSVTARDDGTSSERAMRIEGCQTHKAKEDHATHTPCGHDEDGAHMADLERFAVTDIHSSEAPKKIVSVDKYGAKGDGQSDDTEAFEKAWAKACSSAPSILEVPKGKSYLVKPVKFSGPCKSAISMEIYGTIIAPANPDVWKGSNLKKWLHFYSVDDLTLEGGGTIYGSGEKWWAKSCKIKKSNPCSSAPTAVTFESTNNLRVRNLHVKNSPQMHIVFQKCAGVQAENLHVTAPEKSPNTDGIHVTASKYVVIENCIIGTGDDCISIVSGSNNIRSKNITCGPGHGISIGSLGKGNSAAYVSSVMVDGASLHDTTNGLRIKTWEGGSGFARSITFQNVQMKNVSHPIIIDQHYCDSSKHCTEQPSAVKVSNVMYKNVQGTTPTMEAVNFNCSRSVPCEEIVLQNIHLTMNSGGTPTSYCQDAEGSTRGIVVPASCLENQRIDYRSIE